MKKKKSKFWLGIFSLVPGAGEMYLGFMKMGVSLMLLCGLSMVLVGATQLPALTVLPITIYIYSFFHANNLGRMDDQAFQEMEDRYLFGMDGWFYMRRSLSGRYRNVAAGALILLGLVMVWNAVFSMLCDVFGWDNEVLQEIYRFMQDEFPRLLFGAAIIWGGIALLRGRKKESPVVEDKIPEEDVRNVQEAYARVTQTAVLPAEGNGEENRTQEGLTTEKSAQEEGKTDGREDNQNA